MRHLSPLLIVVLLVALAGCGGSSEETTPSAPAGIGAWEERVQKAWERSPDCKRPAGASRWGCSIDSYRCQAVVVDRGWSVSCAKPGRSLAFRVLPD
jgi:hypothetical protein